MHVTPTHNIPSFDKRNQLEGGVSVGATGLNVNVAYTPIKNLLIQGNAYTLPTGWFGPNYNNYAEGAIGTFLSNKHIQTGFNFGAGIGSVAWDYVGIYSYYNLVSAKFSSTYELYHFYIGFKPKRDTSFLLGPSIKISNFHDHYSETKYEAFKNEPSKPFSNNQSIWELVFFLKKKINNHIGFNINAGFSIRGKYNYDNYIGVLIARAGLNYKF